MKKLILYNHLGEKIGELDVFVEGSDFRYDYPKPTCLWLGSILLVDKEPEPQVGVEVPEEVAEDIAAYEAREVASKEETAPEKGTMLYRKAEDGVDRGEGDKIVKCSKCLKEFALRDCNFGHDDFFCPTCGTETLEEVKIDETEATSDKSIRESRVSKEKQPPSPERPSKKSAGRKANRRSKRVRDSKSA